MAGADRNEQKNSPESAVGPNEQYCVSCGGVISSEADICPDCGAPQDGGSNQVQGGGQNKANLSNEGERAFKRAIDDKKVEGWDVKSREGDRVILIKQGFGSLGSHVLVAILTAWWTFFLGNAIYAAYKYFIDTNQMVIRKSEFTS